MRGHGEVARSGTGSSDPNRIGSQARRRQERDWTGRQPFWRIGQWPQDKRRRCSNGIPASPRLSALSSSQVRPGNLMLLDNEKHRNKNSGTSSFAPEVDRRPNLVGLSRYDGKSTIRKNPRAHSDGRNSHPDNNPAPKTNPTFRIAVCSMKQEHHENPHIDRQLLHEMAFLSRL